MNNVFSTSVASKLFPSAEVENVVRLEGGVSASVYRLDLKLPDGETRRLVVRAHSATHSNLSAELEYQLLQALHRKGIPVPMPIHVDESGNLQSVPYLVLDFVEGTSVVSKEDEVAKVGLMADAMAKIHNISTNDLPSLPMRLDPLPEVFDYLPVGSQWNILRNHLNSMSETLYKEHPVLLHGDFWPENLLWQNGGIAAVLDWEDAAFGDPLSDVACCRLELRYKFGELRMQQFTQAYAKHHLVDPERLALWQVYVAAAAQHFMGDWGLTKTKEVHMRKEALSSIREAGAALMGGKIL